MEPREIDKVGTRFVEGQRLRYVLGGQHDLGLRAGRPYVAQQPQVVSAAEDVVGDAGNHELRVLDADVTQGVGMRNVAIDRADPTLSQLPHDFRVEVDDKDLAEKLFNLQRIAVMFELMKDRAGVPEEAEEHKRLVARL